MRNQTVDEKRAEKKRNSRSRIPEPILEPHRTTKVVRKHPNEIPWDYTNMRKQ